MFFSFILTLLSLLVAATQLNAKAATSRLSALKRGPGCDGLGEGALSDFGSFRLTVPGGGQTYYLVLRDTGKKVGDAVIYGLAVRDNLPPLCLTDSHRPYLSNPRFELAPKRSQHSRLTLELYCPLVPTVLISQSVLARCPDSRPTMEKGITSIVPL